MRRKIGFGACFGEKKKQKLGDLDDLKEFIGVY